MRRDNIKNESYWEAYLSEQDLWIEKIENALKETKNQYGDTNNKIIQLSGNIFEMQKEKFYAMYSIGANVSALRNVYAALTDAATRLGALTYNELQLLLSLAILLEYDIVSNNLLSNFQEKIDKGLQAMFSEEKVSCEHDFWLGLLISHIQKTQYIITNKRIFFEESKEFWKLTNELIKASPDDRLSLFTLYMKNWYEFNKDKTWYDFHKRKDNVYYGYWAFECGALAKIMGLTATQLNGVQFLPIDLL